MKIQASDLHDATLFGKQGFCAKGCRAFAAAHGLDWQAFVCEGVDSDVLLATGDDMAAALVRHVQEKALAKAPVMHSADHIADASEMVGDANIMGKGL
jgi:hypothetical protein